MMLVLYSDGITEAENPAGQPLEEAGLQVILDSYPDDGRPGQAHHQRRRAVCAGITVRRRS